VLKDPWHDGLLARKYQLTAPNIKLTLCKRACVLSTVVTIALVGAVNWALSIGNLVSAFILAVGCLYLHSYRSVMTFIRRASSGIFPQWLLMRGSSKVSPDTDRHICIVSKPSVTSHWRLQSWFREVALLCLSAILPMSDPCWPPLPRASHDAAIWLTCIRLEPGQLMITSADTAHHFHHVLYPGIDHTVLLGEKWEHTHPC